MAAIYFALAMFGASSRSGTFDEYAHVTGGYSYWTLNDYRVHPENGNLAQRLVALPIVASQPLFPSLDQDAWTRSDFWAITDQFFFGGANDPDDMLRRARILVATVGAVLCLLLFAWSRHLWGYTGAWITLILFAFNPTALAHGGLATSDIIATAFFIASAWSLWIVLHRVTALTVIASMLTTAGLFLSKYSAVVMIPVAISMLIVRFAKSRGSSAPARPPAKPAVLASLTLAHVIAIVAIIWASYGFRYSAFNPQAGRGSDFLDPWSEVADSSVASSTIQWARRHEVMPEAYLYGFSTVLAYSKNRSAFANGDTRQGGWWWFFPYATLVKATLPTLLLIVTTPLLLVWARRTAARNGTGPPPLPFYEATPLLFLIAWYWAFALVSHLNIGQRHMLPVTAATAILLGAAGEPISRLRRLTTSGSRNA